MQVIVLAVIVLFANLFGQGAVAAKLSQYNHPLGFAFQYPADWRIESNQDFTQLLPPGLTGSDQTENYRILTQESPIPSTDPRFGAELESMAAQIPGFTKVGVITNYRAGNGVGLKGVWTGTNAATNQPVQLRMYATTVNGIAIVLFAAGAAARLDVREASLRAIASSVGPAGTSKPAAPITTSGALTDKSPQAELWRQKLQDRKLTWLSSYGSGSSGGMSSKTELRLNRNGSFSVYTESLVSMSVPGASGSSGGTNKASGTWRIYFRNGQVLLETKYENGQVETSLLEERNGQTFINGKRWFLTD